jgi:hypothetical protein
MAESFTLPVMYKDRNLEFNAELRTSGYIHRIAVDVNGTEVIFEPDEERSYRAIVHHEHVGSMEKNRELISAIATALEEAFK